VRPRWIRDRRAGGALRAVNCAAGTVALLAAASQRAGADDRVAHRAAFYPNP
jgi:hypothetical protein